MQTQAPGDLINQFNTVRNPEDDLVLIDYALDEFHGKFCFTRPSRHLQQDPFLSSLEVANDSMQAIGLIWSKFYALHLTSPTPCPVPHGLNIKMLHTVIMAMATDGMFLAQQRIGKQVHRLQIEIAKQQQSLIRPVALDGRPFLDLVSTACYDYDFLVHSWDLVYTPPAKDMDWKDSWQHQHSRGLAWQYCQEMTILRHYHGEVQLKEVAQVLKEANLMERLQKCRQTIVQLGQLFLVQGVLNSA